MDNLINGATRQNSENFFSPAAGFRRYGFTFSKSFAPPQPKNPGYTTDPNPTSNTNPIPKPNPHLN